MTLLALPLDQLVVSPLNVRTNEEDATSVDALAASISAHGLLFPLVVHDLDLLIGSEFEEFADRQDATHGVLAGGRRLLALRQLAADSRIDPTESIECVVRDVPLERITELSLSENLLRRELRPYEIHAAVARAMKQGATVESFASDCGQNVSWVRKQLRLGSLVPEIFDALATGRISDETARAYAATEDQALQREAWAYFKPLPDYQHTPAAIRVFYKVGDRELEKQLQFVGDVVYRGRGGRFELDLFAAGARDRGRVVDEELLRRLVAEKRAEVTNRIRAEVGECDLQFQPAPPQYAGHTDYGLEIVPAGGDWTAFRIPRGAPIEAIVAVLKIEDDGDWDVRFWWASRAAKGAAEKGKPMPAAPDTPLAGEAFDTGEPGARRGAQAIVRDRHGFTKDGLQVVRSTRRMLLRSVLLANADGGGTLGRDYLVWAQLRREFTADREGRIGMRFIASEWSIHEEEPTETVRPWLDEQAGTLKWEADLARCAQLPAFKIAEPEEAFAAYHLELPEEEKNRCAAIAAGLALLRSAATEGLDVAVHDRIAELGDATDEQLRRFWKPTPAFLGLLPKMKRMELAKPYAPRTVRDWAKLKDKPLSAAAAAALDRQDEWLHPLLSFARPSSPATPIEQSIPATEAAE
ncbi:ParB/RepB/Spo0J family partition protein [Erythrobacter litoralis]|uniref:ParB/RepB/Spo0J family partition protein n=1 Tax=Erythrobacter litoralis TaxID=39960 RepID=UPI0024357740|nr:ParB/RepB/Spo0J family partition protein [Erythrobacter litoralis]MDG6079782.1 ParB/RepB/Spo0J family partition protein [Erythrobacter litoralis]